MLITRAMPPPSITLAPRGPAPAPPRRVTFVTVASAETLRSVSAETLAYAGDPGNGTVPDPPHNPDVPRWFKIILSERAVVLVPGRGGGGGWRGSGHGEAAADREGLAGDVCGLVG